jgi:2-hydroxy-4-carboxymuconate semialdehyde hemiacetal dehydrogenase
MHTQTALAALAHGKHTLVEIPLALSLADAEQVVAAAEQRGLTLGVVHPIRMRPDLVALRQRVQAGEEHIRHISGRFFIHRLENIGATGYVRSWTDNLLWHHITHLLDAGLWLLQSPVQRIYSFMPSPHERTGVPMEVSLSVETEQEQTLVCTGSYYGRERIFELLVITERESYRLDIFQSTLTTGAGSQAIASEPDTCALIIEDFLQAVREERQPAISGRSVLPTMRVLQHIQDQWDQQHGVQSIPGRPVS